LQAPKKRITTLSVITLAAAALVGCGSPRTTVVEDASLETAIACYIDGDLDRAETLLVEITGGSHSDEVFRTAYLYLGRIYLARGDYVKAADALSAGRILGSDPRLDEYFEIARSHLAASPSRVSQIEAITRGELADLVDHVFGEALRGRPEAQDGGLGYGRHENRDGEGDASIVRLSRAGIMDLLPDGEIHAEERVSWPALYAVSSRIVGALGGARDALNEAFPGGYRGALEKTVGGDGEAAPARFVSGVDAFRVCRTLARELGIEATR
jgi:hypothetical protein